MKLFRSKDESGPFGARADAPLTAGDEGDFTDDVAGDGTRTAMSTSRSARLPG